jgi:hypothetical protein
MQSLAIGRNGPLRPKHRHGLWAFTGPVADFGLPACYGLGRCRVRGL